MLVAVVIAFFFCYSPFHAQRVMAAVFGRLDPNVQVTKQVEQLFNFFTHISGITYYLSACLNPVLYQVFSKKFQLALKETLPCCRKWARRGEHDDMNASTVLPANTGSGSGGGGSRPIVGYGHHHQHLHTPTGMGAGAGRRPIPPASASATNQSSSFYNSGGSSSSTSPKRAVSSSAISASVAAAASPSAPEGEK